MTKKGSFQPIELSYSSLEPAMATAELVFPYLKDKDDPSWPKYMFPASLDMNNPKQRDNLDAFSRQCLLKQSQILHKKTARRSVHQSAVAEA